VKSRYLDFSGEAVPRKWYNFDNSSEYVDNSARNDIVRTAVTHDAENVYFRVETKDDITPWAEGDLKWMNILIKTVNGGDNNVMGYQYAVGRRPLADGKTTVQRSKGGNNYTKTGEGDYRVEGNVLQISVPIAALGLDARNFEMEFKVTDNIRDPENTLDFYTTGDSAPAGRLGYKYGY
jgi:hypothetical protein